MGCNARKTNKLGSIERQDEDILSMHFITDLFNVCGEIEKKIK
jgi:hypothetical protein